MAGTNLVSQNQRSRFQRSLLPAGGRLSAQSDGQSGRRGGVAADVHAPRGGSSRRLQHLTLPEPRIAHKEDVRIAADRHAVLLVRELGDASEQAKQQPGFHRVVTVDARAEGGDEKLEEFRLRVDGLDRIELFQSELAVLVT